LGCLQSTMHSPGFALSWKVISSKLGVMEVHVGDKEWNHHMKPHNLLDKSSEIWQFVVASV
jgi:hypothetical protein